MVYDQLDYLTRLFEQEVENNRIGGCSVIVEYKGVVVYHKCFGSDQEDSIYRIYSMTKPVTAVAAMILYERGQLDLMEPVSNYLPAFADVKVFEGNNIVKAKQPITISHLLNMTSGIVYPGAVNPASRLMADRLSKLFNQGLGTVDICNGMAQVPLHFHPGEDWYYGASAEVLGAVIEVCSGMKFGEFLKKEVFEPLDMVDTGFLVPTNQIHRLASMYMMKSDETIQPITKDALSEIQVGDPTKEPFMEMGGGGLFSTTHDYLKFARILLHGGSYEGVRILGPKTVQYMTQNQLTDKQRASMWFNSTCGYGYGNLMRVMLEQSVATSNGSIGEYGWDGLAGTYFCADPKEELIIVYMQQNKDGAHQMTRRKMRNIIYGAI